MPNGNHKPTVTRHIKFDLELDSAMREIAEREQRSLHNLTRLLLREAIAARTGVTDLVSGKASVSPTRVVSQPEQTGTNSSHAE